jgi:hypothetical protein
MISNTQVEDTVLVTGMAEPDVRLATSAISTGPTAQQQLTVALQLIQLLYGALGDCLATKAAPLKRGAETLNQPSHE